MFKKILFPTDFLEGSRKAAIVAAELVRKYSAKLYIIHVIHDVLKTTGLYVPHIAADELFRSLQEEAEKQIKKEYLEETRGLKDITYTILRGVPYEEICKFAEKENIDLIVIASHARKGLDRVIFGSTAAKVVRHAPCAVLTVRIKD